jgi:glyoxylate/hydroxypyruvate reductase
LFDPWVTIVRVAIEDLISRMTKYGVFQVPMLHRQQLYLWGSPCHDKRREPKFQRAANAIHVGILELGILGPDAAPALKRLGFRVSGRTL